MRVTVTIEDRIARELKRIAQHGGKSFKVVVDETLEAGLLATQKRRNPKPYRLRTASLGSVQQGINLDKALAVSDSIGDEEDNP